MSNNERKSNLTSISDLLQAVFQNAENPLSKPYMLMRIRLNWREIVGEEISKVSRPIGYKKLTLYLNVDHPAVIQNLTFLNRSIIEKVNGYVGKKWIRSVRFTTLKHVDGIIEI